MASPQMTGSEIVLKALRDQGVEVIFGYPGGAWFCRIIPVPPVLSS